LRGDLLEPNVKMGIAIGLIIFSVGLILSSSCYSKTIPGDPVTVPTDSFEYRDTNNELVYDNITVTNVMSVEYNDGNLTYTRSAGGSWVTIGFGTGVMLCIGGVIVALLWVLECGAETRREERRRKWQREREEREQKERETYRRIREADDQG